VPPSWIADLRRLGNVFGSAFALPATGTADEGTWFELRPDGVPAVAVANPERWADLAEAEEAARRLRLKHPDFRFVEIMSYEIRDGNRSAPSLVGRV
jgi:hypothetical protein